MARLADDARSRRSGFASRRAIGNFLLIHFPDEAGRARAEADAFLRERGLVLRRVAGYGFPNALRMSVGTEEANRAVVAALAEFPRAGSRDGRRSDGSP